MDKKRLRKLAGIREDTHRGSMGRFNINDDTQVLDYIEGLVFDMGPGADMVSVFKEIRRILEQRADLET